MQDLGLTEESTWWAVLTVKVLIAHQCWFDFDDASEGRAYRVLRSWLEDGEMQRLLQVNRYQDVLWFNQEAFEQVLWWMMVIATVTITVDETVASAGAVEACYDVIQQLQAAEAASDFRVEALLEAART